MKQFTIITKSGSKWLKPINVPYPNADEYEDGNEPHPAFARADAVIYEEMTRPVVYLGSRPEGTKLYEIEVSEVRQMRYEGKWVPAEEDLIDFAYLETRTAYVDVARKAEAESHDRHISDEVHPVLAWLRTNGEISEDGKHVTYSCEEIEAFFNKPNWMRFKEY